jgi:hypothetical protein
MVMAWQSPVNGVVDIKWKVSPARTDNGVTLEIQHSNPQQSLWSRIFSRGEYSEESLENVHVQKGDRIYFVADSQPGYDGNESISFENLLITLKSTSD